MTYDEYGNLFIMGSGECAPQTSNYCTSPTTSVFPICPPLNPDIFFQDNGGGTPVLQGLSDAFIAGFTPDRSLGYSSYLGGNKDDFIRKAIHYEGNMYFVGQTSSPENFPILCPSSFPDAFKKEELSDSKDAFIGKLIMPMDISTSSKEVDTKQVHSLIFPNPAYDVLNINLASPSKGEFIQLYDYSGRLIQQKYLEKNIVSTSINIHHLLTGVYCLRINNEGYLFVKK